MKNPKITHKITQGIYVLTTNGGGCLVDAVARVGGSEQPLISVSVAKTNKTHELLQNNPKFALSVLGEGANPELIQTFGFRSSRDTDKLSECATEIIEEVEIVKDSLGYMILEKVDTIENDTHTLFIGKMIEADVFEADSRPMTYAYYQEHRTNFVPAPSEPTEDSAKTNSTSASVEDLAKTNSVSAPAEPAEDLTKATSEQGKTAWVCTVCGHVYYGDEVPDDYRCPLCGLGKAYFKRKTD